MQEEKVEGYTLQSRNKMSENHKYPCGVHNSEQRTLSRDQDNQRSIKYGNDDNDHAIHGNNTDNH